MAGLSTLLFLLVLLEGSRNFISATLRFENPYFIILGSDTTGQDIVIQTDTCISGGYTNVPIPVKRFCATGFWILISEWCGNENGQKYFVAARDSCYEIPDSYDIQVKRFIPILQKNTDFEGYAYAWRDEMSYFIRLKDKEPTILKPMDGPNKDWHVLTVNNRFYGHNLHETVFMGRNVSRRCYSSSYGRNSEGIFQMYKMQGDQPYDAVFDAYNGDDAPEICKHGYRILSNDVSRPTGVMWWNIGAETLVMNSTSSFLFNNVDPHKLNTPVHTVGKQIGQCSVDNPSPSYPSYLDQKTSRVKTYSGSSKYPMFPHEYPLAYTDQMITDEIQETAIEFTKLRLQSNDDSQQNIQSSNSNPDMGLVSTPSSSSNKVPIINHTEYHFIHRSSLLLGKFCCTSRINADILKYLRILLRLTLSFYQDYFSYQMESNDEGQNARIFAAIDQCWSRTDISASPPPAANGTDDTGAAAPAATTAAPAPAGDTNGTAPAPAPSGSNSSSGAGGPCIQVQTTTSCPETLDGSYFNETTYEFEMPEELQYEEGNLDYVLETAWKSMLFVHYFCTPFFADPIDHSAFAVKVNGFFNPVLRSKWIRPQNAHRVYQFILSDVDLRKFGEAVDVCVDTAYQTSQYTRWLARPTDEDVLNRKKRAISSSGRKGRNAGRSADYAANNCVPKTHPQIYCLEKQFDTIDKNLVHPKVTSGDCYNSYQNRGKYKYIHASTYDTTY